jgi:hypothetical protein
MTNQPITALQPERGDYQSIIRTASDLPAVKKNPIALRALRMADEHSFGDPELAEEAGEARRALAHAAINDLHGQVATRSVRLQNIVCLDQSLNVVAQALKAGMSGVKLFGKITYEMYQNVQAGYSARFESNKWDWDVRLVNSSGEVVPASALERLTRLRMDGVQPGDLMIATPVPHPHVQTRFDDPVLLVRLPYSPFLIEIARWE